MTEERTPTQLNAFDFIVAVALGSMVASVSLTKPGPSSKSPRRWPCLAVLQMLAAWAAVRPATPGRSDRRADQRVGSAPGGAEFRLPRLDQMAAVVLETKGKRSVIGRSQTGHGLLLLDAQDADRRS